MSDFNERIEKLNELIAKSERIVFFGGAGVSTESGIPDFRSKDGLYNNRGVEFEKYDPEYLLSIDCLNSKPEVFFEFYRQKLDCRNVEPNITHRVLADMEKRNKLLAVITQNIDGLHQKAGSENVYEVHGTTLKNYCRRCNKPYDKNYIFNCNQDIPKCECGGVIRPDVTLYGEMLPNDAWNRSTEAISKSDLLIVGGTSLSVYPAANLISNCFGNLVLINRDKTQYDDYADIVFHENLGEVFSKINY